MSEQKEEKKDAGPKAQQEAPKMRQIVIETDGNQISITKNETAGGLELAAVLQTILARLSR